MASGLGLLPSLAAQKQQKSHSASNSITFGDEFFQQSSTPQSYNFDEDIVLDFDDDHTFQQKPLPQQQQQHQVRRGIRTYQSSPVRHPQPQQYQQQRGGGGGRGGMGKRGGSRGGKRSHRNELVDRVLAPSVNYDPTEIDAPLVDDDWGDGVVVSKGKGKDESDSPHRPTSSSVKSNSVSSFNAVASNPSTIVSSGMKNSTIKSNAGYKSLHSNSDLGYSNSVQTGKSEMSSSLRMPKVSNSLLDTRLLSGQEFPDPELISLSSGDYEVILKSSSNPNQSLGNNDGGLRVENMEEAAHISQYYIKKKLAGAQSTVLDSDNYLDASTVKTGQRARVQVSTDWDTVWEILVSQITVSISAKEEVGYVIICTHGPVERDIVRIRIGFEKADLFEIESVLLEYLVKFQYKQSKGMISKEYIRDIIVHFLKPSRNFLSVQGNGFIFLYGSMESLELLAKSSQFENSQSFAHAVRWPTYLTSWDDFANSLHALADFNEKYTLESDGGRIRRVFFVRPIFEQEDIGFFCLVEAPTAEKLGRVTVPGGPRYLAESAYDCAFRKLKGETGLVLKIECDTLAVYHDQAAVTFFLNVDDPSLKEVRVFRRFISKEGESRPRFRMARASAPPAVRHNAPDRFETKVFNEL